MACYGDSTEKPYIDIGLRGPEGVFPAAKVEAMVALLEKIR